MHDKDDIYLYIPIHAFKNWNRKLDLKFLFLTYNLSTIAHITEDNYFHYIFIDLE